MPCCELCGIFPNCGAELLGVTVCGYGTSVCGPVLMQRMRQKVIYQVMAVLCIMRGFSKHFQLNPVSCW